MNQMPIRDSQPAALRARAMHSQLFSNPRAFFDSPEPAGRKITAGFTYIQRISKPASYDVWFPDRVRRNIAAKIAQGIASSTQDFPAHWGAVRQFELLQEAGNHKIYDLDPAELRRAFRDLARGMRAGGYRVTVAMLGTYRETSSGDELEIIDSRLQKSLAQMIHMLYLDEVSADANAATAFDLAQGKWDYRDALPHVGMVLGAQDLFQRGAATEQPDQHSDEKKKGKGTQGSGGGGGIMPHRKHRNARSFFDVLGLLPQKHIVHDTVIGLQLPELTGENHWNYIAESDETLGAFIRSLNDLFDPFNHISLGRLNERDGAGTEVKSSTFHMRSYGHPVHDADLSFYRHAALAL